MAPEHPCCFSGQREGRKTAPSRETCGENAVLEHCLLSLPARVRELLLPRGEKRGFSCFSVAFETDLALRPATDGAARPDRLRDTI